MSIYKEVEKPCTKRENFVHGSMCFYFFLATPRMW